MGVTYRSMSENQYLWEHCCADECDGVYDVEYWIFFSKICEINALQTKMKEWKSAQIHKINHINFKNAILLMTERFYRISSQNCEHKQKCLDRMMSNRAKKFKFTFTCFRLSIQFCRNQIDNNNSQAIDFSSPDSKTYVM